MAVAGACAASPHNLLETANFKIQSRKFTDAGTSSPLECAEWGGSISIFPQLRNLDLSSNMQAGSVPEGWASSWQRLSHLHLDFNSLTSLPASDALAGAVHMHAVRSDAAQLSASSFMFWLVLRREQGKNM